MNLYHEVIVEEKWKRVENEANKKCDLRNSKQQEMKNHEMVSPHVEKDMKGPSFKLLFDIEASIDLKNVLEERILDSKVELFLRDLLGITKKEFHEVIIDNIKRKHQNIEVDAIKEAEVNKLMVEIVKNQPSSSIVGAQAISKTSYELEPKTT